MSPNKWGSWLYHWVLPCLQTSQHAAGLTDHCGTLVMSKQFFCKSKFCVPTKRRKQGAERDIKNWVLFSLREVWWVFLPNQSFFGWSLWLEGLWPSMEVTYVLSWVALHNWTKLMDQALSTWRLELHVSVHMLSCFLFLCIFIVRKNPFTLFCRNNLLALQQKNFAIRVL